MTETPPPPEFEVRLAPPDLGEWLAGNTGIPGVTTLESGRPGPHLALTALMHGNEFSGAIALERLLRSGFHPRTGRLSCVFMNIEAFLRFDPCRPTVSRFVDEDMNRLWDDAVLNGPRRSLELDRAREVWSLLSSVDVVLDLHSMLWPSDPVTLCGLPDKGRGFALEIGGPGVVVADRGHDNGRRLIDHPRFSDPGTPYVGVLIEAGQHWEPETVEIAWDSVQGALRRYDMTPETPLGVVERVPRFARVTHAVTAATSQFAFVRGFRGGEVVPERNTLLAMDGDTEVRTPYDDCLLVLPTLRPGRGHTAVRLARFEAT